jgi:hypothetical protein
VTEVLAGSRREDAATTAPDVSTDASPAASSAGRLLGRVATRPPVLLAALALAGTATVAAVDPGEPGHYPTCPFLAVTGLWCPGCGGLRAVHALTRGDVGAALGYNALLVLALPVLAVLWVRWARRDLRTGGSRPTGTATAGGILPPVPTYVLVALVVLVLAFWVARNLPAGAVLAP